MAPSTPTPPDRPVKPLPLTPRGRASTGPITPATTPPDCAPVRTIPFAALGASGTRTTARDSGDIIRREWSALHTS